MQPVFFGAVIIQKINGQHKSCPLIGEILYGLFLEEKHKNIKDVRKGRLTISPPSLYFYYIISGIENQQKCKNVEKWVHKCRNLSNTSRQSEKKLSLTDILSLKKEDVKTRFLHPLNAFTAVYLSSSDGCQLKV